MSKEINTKKDFLILFILGSILSFVSGYIYFSSSSIDVEEVKGVYSSFDYLERTTNTTSKMKINLEDDSFIIPSYLESSFKTDVFKKKVFKGDSIFIFVDSDGFVSQIKSENNFYFDEEKRGHLMKSNKKIALIVSLVFFLISIYSLVKFIKK